MAFDDLIIGGNISASGLTAERRRMEVVANNIANATATRGGPGGGPYRRQEVLFETVMLNQLTGARTAPGIGGVRVVDVQDDPSAFQRIHNPGHPDADADGFLSMPNVFLPIEMVNLMTASRSYEANLKVLQSLKQQLEQTLTLLRT